MLDARKLRDFSRTAMRRNFMRNNDVSDDRRVRRCMGGLTFVLAILMCVGLMLSAAAAQSGGQGAISGTVTDSTGALVPNAVVVARNNGTGIETKRTASSDGLYNITPLIPGTYTVTVTANGFPTFKQENITVDALSNVGLN